VVGCTERWTIERCKERVEGRRGRGIGNNLEVEVVGVARREYWCSLVWREYGGGGLAEGVVVLMGFWYEGLCARRRMQG
jgi:hypothetical protein